MMPKGAGFLGMASLLFHNLAMPRLRLAPCTPKPTSETTDCSCTHQLEFGASSQLFNEACYCSEGCQLQRQCIDVCCHCRAGLAGSKLQAASCCQHVPRIKQPRPSSGRCCECHHCLGRHCCQCCWQLQSRLALPNTLVLVCPIVLCISLTVMLYLEQMLLHPWRI